MRDQSKTKAQLISELVELRHRISELGGTGRGPMESEDTGLSHGDAGLSHRDAGLSHGDAGLSHRDAGLSPGDAVLEELQQRNRALELLNRAGQAFVSTLDLEQVLATVLEEVRQALDVVGSSVWLTDQETGELVCRQSAGPGSKTVRGWRLAPGQGIAGWVAHSGQILIVPDVYADRRYFSGVEHESGVALRSILTVPVRVKQNVIGVIQAVDTQPDRFTPSDLTVIESLASAAAVAIENARLYQRAQHEIAERMRTEEALRESKERYRTLFEQANDGIHLANGNDEILDVNQRMCEMMGYSREELLSMRIPDLQAPEVRGQAGSVLKSEVACYGNASFEALNIRSDGGRIPIELSISRVKGLEGDLYISIVRDITERKLAEVALRESNRRLEETLAELKSTQKKVVQQERLAAVGQLAAGIAHDFNNLLTSIIGYAELVHMRTDIPPTAQADLVSIVKQGHRAAHLIQQILDFSRKSIRQPQPLDLAPFLKEVTKFLKRTIPETIHLQLEIEPSACLVQADPTQFQQMVTNLAVNARDAMPGGGELKLRLSRLTLKPGEKPPSPEMPPGEWVVLSVSDTGTGIPAQILPRIFEPFFTTRAPQGSGLGLAQVYGIVKQHEAHIDVESEVGQGTTFTIYMPALAESERAAGEGGLNDIPHGRGQTLLLVEDESSVLDVGKNMLEHLGYRVLTAEDGGQALKIYMEHQDEIALVLADMVMPRMDGIALFHALQAQRPGIKVILMSGYPPEEAQKTLGQGMVDWLQKPMTLRHLAQVVSGALRR
jgi:PAS domain S-box-containing protein